MGLCGSSQSNNEQGASAPLTPNQRRVSNVVKMVDIMATDKANGPSVPGTTNQEVGVKTAPEINGSSSEMKVPNRSFSDGPFSFEQSWQATADQKTAPNLQDAANLEDKFAGLDDHITLGNRIEPEKKSVRELNITMRQKSLEEEVMTPDVRPRDIAKGFLLVNDQVMARRVATGKRWPGVLTQIDLQEDKFTVRYDTGNSKDVPGEWILLQTMDEMKEFSKDKNKEKTLQEYAAIVRQNSD